MNPCFPHTWPRLSPARVAEIVGWNRTHQAWVTAHAVIGNCTRAASLAAPLLGPIVPALVVPVGAPAIVQPYPEFRGAGYQVPATAGIAPGASDAAGFAPVFPAAPFTRLDQGHGALEARPAVQGPQTGAVPALPAVGGSPTPIRIDTPALDTFDVPNLLIPAGPIVGVPEQPVPEPGTLALLGLACVALGVLRRWGGYP